jgi:H+/Cl- antiporter ClcA
VRSFQGRAARWFASASYGRKWLVLGALIGIIAGLGAMVFYDALSAATHLFLGVIAGYSIPTPVGEGSHAASAHFARPWAIPLVACVGALAGGVVVFTIAPAAAGHGTDAAIDAVHHNPRGIRLRTVVVKIVASAPHHWVGWLRGARGADGPDQCRVRVVPRAILRSQPI